MDDDALLAWSVIDLVTPVVVRVAATLGLLRRIAEQPLPIPRLAAELALRPDLVRRLLRLLAVRGVVRVGPGDVVEATGVGRLLADGPNGPVVTRLDWTGAAGELDRIVVRNLLWHCSMPGPSSTAPCWNARPGSPNWPRPARRTRTGCGYSPATSSADCPRAATSTCSPTSCTTGTTTGRPES